MLKYTCHYCRHAWSGTKEDEPCPICTQRLTTWYEDNPQKAVDIVNHPPHYTTGKVECIEAIEAALTPEEFRGYVKGVVIKYMWREKHKGGDEDLQKARWYLNRLIAKAEATVKPVVEPAAPAAQAGPGVVRKQIDH